MPILTIREVCNINHWSIGYYDVDDSGEIIVRPNPSQHNQTVSLQKLTEAVQQKHQARLPVLFCFPQILEHRLRDINRAFQTAREECGYKGGYCLVYPIKVNQHRRVIESLMSSGQPHGLEAGSKAELMAVLAHAYTPANINRLQRL